jgi:hypothetical protein
VPVRGISANGRACRYRRSDDSRRANARRMLVVGRGRCAVGSGKSRCGNGKRDSHGYGSAELRTRANRDAHHCARSHGASAGRSRTGAFAGSTYAIPNASSGAGTVADTRPRAGTDTGPRARTGAATSGSGASAAATTAASANGRAYWRCRGHRRVLSVPGPRRGAPDRHHQH